MGTARIMVYEPDLFLMDIGLKGTMDGIEAARIIQDSMKVTVIFLTGFTDNATVLRAEDADTAGYIVKPICEDELQQTLAKALP
ncbi:MAG: response regulator [Candidatus Aminicenantaceae bacterium]